MPAPIVLFCYNRLKSLQKTITALSANPLAEKSELFVFSDGPKASKGPQDLEKVQEVRKYLKTISGFKKIEIREATQNKGLANSVIAGVSEIVEKYGKIIVLEDDLVTAPCFLVWMNAALDFYEKDEDVVSINAYTPPEMLSRLPDLFFLRFCSSWGWATWKRGWQLFNPDIESILDQFDQKKRRIFDFDNAYPFWGMLVDQKYGKIDSWACRWNASVFLSGKLTLNSNKNLISNVGYDSGTHYNNSGLVSEKISLKSPVLPKQSLRKEYLPEVEKTFHDYYSKLLHQSLVSVPVKRQSVLGLIKKIVKHILPYGLVLLIQKYRDNRIRMKQRKMYEKHQS